MPRDQLANIRLNFRCNQMTQKLNPAVRGWYSELLDFNRIDVIEMSRFGFVQTGNLAIPARRTPPELLPLSKQSVFVSENLASMGML